MQGFVILLCLWLGLAVGQNRNDATVAAPTVTPVTHAPTQTPVTLAPELTSESPATLAPEEPTRSTLAPPIVDICTRQGYNLTTLREPSYWKFTVQDKTQCIVPLGNTTSDVQTCTVNFAVCHPILDNTLCPRENSAICQEVILNSGARLYYNMGTYDPKHSYSLDTASGGFAGFRNGMHVNIIHCNGTLRTAIVFNCNSSAVWNPTQTDVTNFVKDFLWDEITDPCLYVMDMQYNGACAMILPPVGEETSPVGWIFIGIFLGLALIYLVVGSAYQYFGKQERGIRILPNYDFWMAFAGYVWAGVLLCLNAVTCFQFGGKFKQVDYDKL